jgi:hypothetical protein
LPLGECFGSYYYFLGSVGRKATVVFGLLRERIDPGGRLLLAIDDTPTKRYGPKVQGAGVHHNPTPGPAGSKFLYGHSWVVLSRIARHEQCGTLGLPLLGRLYIRDKDLPRLPEAIGWTFRTQPQWAADLITWAGSLGNGSAQRPWVVVDGSYANREVIKPAKKAGLVVVARLRRDAKLFDRPPVLKSGQKRGPGRPPAYGKNRLSLAKRAGQQRGWQTVEVATTTGQVVAKAGMATIRDKMGHWPSVPFRHDGEDWFAFYVETRTRRPGYRGTRGPQYPSQARYNHRVPPTFGRVSCSHGERTEFGMAA